MENINVEVNTHQKLNECFGIGPKIDDGNLSPYLIAINPYLFIIFIQGNWSKKEIENFNNPLRLSIAEVDDIIDFVIDIKNCIFVDCAFNTHIKPFDKYEKLQEDEGMAFHVVAIDNDCIVLNQRLFSMMSKESNLLIQVLNENIEKNISQEQFNKNIFKIFNEMSISEIEANSFLEYRTKKH